MAAQLALFDELLDKLKGGETRRGAGREVDKQPAPSTRGTGDGSEPASVRQVVVIEIADTVEARRRTWELDALAEAPTLPAIPDSDEAEWLACGCPTPQVMRTLDEVRAALLTRVPDGAAVAAVTFTRDNAARAVHEAGGLVASLEPLARKLAKRRAAKPIEKLAGAVVERKPHTVDRRPHAWRKWEGDAKSVGVCVVCGAAAGYSVNGRRYCAEHEGEADRALRRSLRGSIDTEVAA